MPRLKTLTPPICHPEREYYSKGLCKNCYTKNYRAEKGRAKESGTPASRKRNGRWRDNNRESFRKAISNSQRVKKFGLTNEEYYAKLSSQNGLCALCKLPFYGEKFFDSGFPVLDHNHVDGKVREFLHRMCNTAIGQLKEDPKICRQAAEYLEKHQGETNVSI